MQTGERLGPLETHIKIDDYIDSNHHLNNVAWGLHLETGRTQTAVALGIDLQMPLRLLRIRFKRQILEADSITVNPFQNSI